MRRKSRVFYSPEFPRSFPPDLRRLIVRSVVLLAALFSFWFYKSQPPQGYDDVAVVKVYDGDTIKLASGEKVRFLGIDCPELHESDKLYRDAYKSGQSVSAIQAQGQKAFEFVDRLVRGRRVKLEFDQQKKDKYGRLLAYVYVWPAPQDEKLNPAITVYQDLTAKDGKVYQAIFLNATIIKAGFARETNIPPNTSKAGLFKDLYRDAQEHHRGLWQRQD